MNTTEYTYKSVRKRKKDFITKIILPTLITVLLFILTIFLIIIPRFKAKIMDEKRVMIKELTNSACSVLEKFESYEREGLLTRTEAQKQAIEQIRHLRYGEEHKDYFWISDMRPNMVMHPYRSDLQGKNLDQFSDPHGKKLFLEFVAMVKANNHGYVDYMWQWKDDPKHIVAKISYVKGFAPWGWIIGTGVYVEDVRKEIRSITHSIILISLAISLVMVLLLALMIQQSTKIEEARLEAENNLLESMEKYRTLVQASTEGLMMLADNRIVFSNSRIQQLTGYGTEELSGQPLEFLLDAGNAPEIMAALRQPVIADSRTEVVLKTKESRLLDVLITVSSIALSGRDGNIIIVKDVTSGDHASLKTGDYRQLISDYRLGAIKLVLDDQGRVTQANDAALGILGYTSLEELADCRFATLFTSQERFRSFRAALMEHDAVRDRSLLLRRKDGSEIMVAVSLMTVGNEGKHPVCEGIIEDVTGKVREKEETASLIADMKLSTLFMEQPVSGHMQKLFSINMHDSVAMAERQMSAKKTDVLSVVTDANEPIGIITFADIRQRAVFKDLKPETSVFEIMSSPVRSVDIADSINDLLQVSAENGINHVVVRDGGAAPAGVVHTKDLPRAFSLTQQHLENRIRNARSVDELKGFFARVMGVAQPLIHQHIRARTIGRLIAAISGSITTRIIELAIEEIGTPPVDFAFIVLGSEGRREQTLETDQDNAIIFSDVPEAELAGVQEYFARLSNLVCSGLHEAGFSYCKGNVMAKNPRWCMPLRTWKDYFSGWINTPDPQNILDVSIFFDFRPVAGNFELAEELRRHVNRAIQDKQLFFYNFAENVLNFKAAVKFTGTILTEKRGDRELFDLKYAVTPVVMFARIYALYKHIDTSNTVERLTILNREKILSDHDFKEILFGYEYLMQLRYRHQIHRADNALPPDNLIDIKELTDIEMALIKKIFSSISRLQSMLSMQFKKTAV